MQFLKMNFAIEAIRMLMAMICQFLYPLISNLYNLFINISKVDILSTEQVKPIYQRVTMILTIIMVFYITFECVKYIVQPEGLTDKEKGVGNIVYRMIIVVVLIAFVPGIFEGAYKLQNTIIERNVIGKVILGNNTNTDPSKFGSTFSSNLLSIGYTVEEENIDAECGDLKCSTIVNMNLNTLSSINKLPYLTMGLDEVVKEKTPTVDEDEVEVPAINFEFHGFMSVLVGGFVAYVLILYCVDVGVRWAQLVFLQIIAPIPIIGYLSPKKDGIFQKWCKQCLTTYLDLFLRTAVIYFILLICSLLLNVYHDGSMLSNVDQSLRTWVFLFLVLGVMMFAQKAPKMLSELFPKAGAASGNLGLSLKDRPMVARAAGGAIGAGLVGAKGAISGTINQAKRNWRNLRSGKTATDRAEYKRSKSDYKQEARENRGARMMNRLKSFSFDKDERTQAKQELQKLNNDLRDKKIAKESAKAAKENSKLRFGTVAGVTGAVGGAVRGATAGAKATDLKSIEKQVQQGLKNESDALAKTEKWYNEGGGSRFDRMKTSIEKNLGISTDSDRYAEEIKVEDDKIKANEALIATESDVKNKVDSAKDRSGSKLEKLEQKTSVPAGETLKIKDLNGNEKTITDGTNTTTSAIYDKYRRIEQTKKSVADAAAKAYQAAIGTPNEARLKMVAENAQKEASEAQRDKEQVKKALEEYAITSILQNPNLAEHDGVLVEKVNDTKKSIETSRRNRETVNKMEAILSTDLFNKYMSGNILTFAELDSIQTALINIANDRTRENMSYKETKRKLESSAANAAAKADSSSGK